MTTIKIERATHPVRPALRFRVVQTTHGKTKVRTWHRSESEAVQSAYARANRWAGVDGDCTLIDTIGRSTIITAQGVQTACREASETRMAREMHRQADRMPTEQAATTLHDKADRLARHEG